MSESVPPGPRVNPFAPVYRACNAGNSREKHATLPAFPRLVDLELTNTCNFRCLMCPTGTFSMKRPKGMMAPDLFERIIAELAPHRTPLRLIRWGEPLLHPNVVDFVARAHRAGLLVHINTNGSKLDDAMIDALIGAGLDSLKFSFQGVDRQSYGEMRNTDFFDDLVETIRRFSTRRGAAARPYLHVSTTITYESRAQVAAFRALIEPLVDLVSVGRTVLDHLDVEAVRLPVDQKEMLARLKQQESVVRKHPECPEVFDKLSINWDGSVSACCGDADKMMVVGDLRDSTLADLWACERLEGYRRMLAEMRHDELPLCRSCYDYHGLQTPGLQDT